MSQYYKKIFRSVILTVTAMMFLSVHEDISVLRNAEVDIIHNREDKFHCTTYGLLRQFCFQITKHVDGAKPTEVTIHVQDVSTKEVVKGDLFSVFAIGDDGGLFRAALTPKPDGTYLAVFASSAFTTGLYTLDIRLEQLCNSAILNQSFSIINPLVLETNAAQSWIDNMVVNRSFDFHNKFYFPVCDNGMNRITTENPEDHRTIEIPVQRSRPTFTVEYPYPNKDAEYNHLSNIGPCAASDFGKGIIPGSFFNSTECNELSNFCCSNTIPGWDRMYRLHSCCIRTVQRSEMERLQKASEKSGKQILFAGDSTLELMTRQASKIWPGIFPPLDKAWKVYNASSFVQFVFIAHPFGNSLKWVVDKPHTEGRRFWKALEKSSMVVFHSCAHDISLKGGTIEGSGEHVSLLNKYERRLNSFVVLMETKYPEIKVLIMSCGTQTFQNFKMSKENWACQKDTSCNMTGRESYENECKIFDVMNLGWALDFIAKEIISNSSQFSFLNVHTQSSVAKADLSLFPHVNTVYNKQNATDSNGLLLTGDIHLAPGRGHTNYKGWMYDLNLHMLFSCIVERLL